MTNYERIKQMSIEEMARCKDICPDSIGICNCKGTCDECRKQWLEMEVEE